MEPIDADNHYTEQLIRLPNLLIHKAPEDISWTRFNRQHFGIKKEAVVYLCCHQLPTHLPQYDDIYPRIAKEVGNCQFLFIADNSNSITDQFSLRISEAFDRYHLKSDDYIVILPRLDKQQYHAINDISDIFLDTIGWSACNSAFEAIACNLPIVTLPGEFMRGRHTTGILRMMGVTDTIVSSIDEYISLAIRLGNDEAWRHEISQKIKDNKNRLYHDMVCISALEDFFEAVVKEYLT
jgi:protein O-GlcNAc transferase